MALFSVTVTEEALGAAALETAVQLAASASKTIELVRWSISFNGTNAADGPVRVQLLRQLSAGTSSDFVPFKVDPSSDAPLARGRTAFTAEPSASDVLETYLVTPYAGLLTMDYAPDARIKIAPSARLGLRCLALSAVGVSATMVFAE